MIAHLPLFSVLVSSLALASTTLAQSSAPAPSPAPGAAPAGPAQALAAYRPIADLNIFNSARIDRSRSGSRPSAPPVQVVTLVGTMTSPKGLLAFFDSNDTAFRKVIPVGEKLGDFKLTRVEADSVELARDAGPVALRVTQQLRREDGGDWAVSEAPPPALPSTPSATTSDRPAASVPANASDALLRMMEKRKQQLQKP